MPHEVTITGLDNGQPDHMTEYEVLFGPTESTDDAFDGLEASIELVNDDGYCGDGHVTSLKSCDDGPDNGQHGACAADCSGPRPYCGDRIVQEEHGEVCDGQEEMHCPVGTFGMGACGDNCQPDFDPCRLPRLALTDESSCAVTNDGHVRCWGRISGGFLAMEKMALRFGLPDKSAMGQTSADTNRH